MVDPNKTIWRVLHLIPGKDIGKILYWGKGKKARIAAEKKYKTVTRKVGRIVLCQGIFPMKSRNATII